jgi:AbrB family looped-hinge helix DNA binding protein
MSEKEEEVARPAEINAYAIEAYLQQAKDLFKAFLEQYQQSKERNIFLAKVLQDGRVTIPVELRELLDIEEGDIVKIEIIETYKSEKTA